MDIKGLLNKDDRVNVSRQDFSLRVAVQRLLFNDIELKEKENNLSPISLSQKKEIEEYWSKKLLWHKNLLNMGYYDVYNAVEANKSKLKYYIPDSFFYAFVDEYYTNPQRSTSLDDKNFYDLYFADVKRPKTLARKINESFLDANYNSISVDKFIEICHENKEVVVKSAIGSYGGHGVMFWDSETNTKEQLLSFIYSDNCKRFDGSNVYQQYIVQEAIHQHPSLANINPTSVNTVRIITLYDRGECVPLSSVLRMGIDGSRVDNCSSGGIVCGITEDGKLKEVAYDAMANAYHSHPQGYEFSGEKVVGYDICVALAKKLACRFCGASRLISWDFAIGEDGEPILIEMNISYGEIDFHQLCNGPIFGKDTDRILKEIFEKNVTLKEIFAYMDD